MKLKGSKKVEGGKLVEVALKKEDGEVVSASLTGDFFLEPPEARQKLEKTIKNSGSNLDSLENELEAIQADMVGFGASDVEDAVKEALEGEEK